MNHVVKMQVLEPVRSREYSPAQLSLIKRTVAADCNDSEFSLFIEVAKRIGLDPFRRQIHAVVYSKDNAEKRKMSIITGIDGFRAVAARNRDYRPDDKEPEITYAEAVKNADTNPLGIVKAVTRAHKYGPDGQWHPVVGVAYWTEYAPIKETADAYDWVETGEVWPDTQKPKKRKVPRGEVKAALDKKGNWFRMPHVMLAKCAEAQAIRKGWPEDLSGIYAHEEMERVDALDLTAAESAGMHDQEQRQRLIGSHGSTAIWWRAGEPLEMVPLGQMFDRGCKFFRECESVTELTNWRDVNRVSLQDFWARAKSDALGLKAELEKRLTQLEANNGGVGK